MTDILIGLAALGFLAGYVICGLMVMYALKPEWFEGDDDGNGQRP